MAKKSKDGWIEPKKAMPQSGVKVKIRISVGELTAFWQQSDNAWHDWNTGDKIEVEVREWKNDETL